MNVPVSECVQKKKQYYSDRQTRMHTQTQLTHMSKNKNNHKHKQHTKLNESTSNEK